MTEFENGPKVSVCVLAYNHEDTIRRCLDGILAQETNFPYEVIVGDDCSKDGTRAILRGYLGRYPGKVRVLFQEKNIGGTRNYGVVHALARGELIAYMDGDDYMLPGKLQAQADGLDANPDCSMCVHEAERFDPAQGKCVPYLPKPHPRKCDLAYLLMNLPFFVSSTKMYRATCRENLDLESKDRLDCYLHVHEALRGNILYLSEVLGGYQLNNGASTDPNDDRETLYKRPAPGILELVLDALDYARQSGVAADLVGKAEGRVYFNYAYSCLIAKDFSGFRAAIRRSAESGDIMATQRVFHVISRFPWFLFLLVRSRAFAKRVFARQIFLQGSYMSQNFKR